MDKKLFNINFKSSFIEYFPYGDEKLFIDMKIKEDEESRKKAKEYAGYLGDLKNYVIFENETEIDEIIEFLKSKSEVLNNISQEEKREYMELKFDILDGKIKVNDNILQEYFTRNFPLSSYFEDNELKLYENYLSFFSIPRKIITDNNIKNFIEQKRVENIITTIKENSELDEINMEYKLYIIIPFIISHLDKTGISNQLLKIIKFNYKDINNNFVSKKEKFYLLKKAILLSKDDREKISENFLFNYIFPKTNLFCDYRFFDREMFKI